MKWPFDPRYPSVDDLRRRARRRIPRFAFEYLDGGCNEDLNLRKNTADIRRVELKPRYLRPHEAPSLATTLFGQRYDAPFGIAPVGLQGLMWPGAAEILARAAHRHNIPFVLSTVSTASIERIAELTEGRAWFQLYHPAEERLRDDLLRRAWDAGLRVLVLLCDVPTFGFRPRDIRNGLAMPPKMTLRNLLQMTRRPAWAWNTLLKGKPRFATLLPYMPKGLDLKELGRFMNETFSGKLDPQRIAALRERWKGTLLLKGVAGEEDAETALELGLDGIIVSNHGGRQLDAGQSAIEALKPIARRFGGRFPVLMDGGMRSGPDIARVLACGARFAFLGRAFMYGVAALGDKGGEHTIALLKNQLQQVLEQLCCERPEKLKEHLVGEGGDR